MIAWVASLSLLFQRPRPIGGIEVMGSWLGGDGLIGFWSFPPLEDVSLAIVTLMPPRRRSAVLVFMLVISLVRQPLSVCSLIGHKGNCLAQLGVWFL